MTGTEVIREVEIAAPRDVVFAYFTDSERFAKWWGEGSKVDARPGGAVFIRYPGGITASGHIKEISPPERVVFTYGYDSGEPIPPGGSTVIVTFAEIPGGTRVRLHHKDLPNAEVARHHVQGWRYQLSLYAKIASLEHHAGASKVLDQWFKAWSETDTESRGRLLRSCAVEDVRFFDDYSALRGYEDLEGQIAAAQFHMGGARIERASEPALCQGHALVKWEMRDKAGAVTARGANAVRLAPDGRIAEVVGFWGT